MISSVELLNSVMVDNTKLKHPILLPLHLRLNNL
jgi:hypothetical protein